MCSGDRESPIKSSLCFTHIHLIESKVGSITSHSIETWLAAHLQLVDHLERQ